MGKYLPHTEKILIGLIYNEILQANKKKANNPIEKGAEEMDRSQMALKCTTNGFKVYNMMCNFIYLNKYNVKQ